MIGLNNYIPTMIYTQRGLISIDQAVYGDMVIEYKTNSKLQILDVIKSESVDLYQVEYTDGRIDIYNIDDLIFNGNYCVYLRDIIDNNKFNVIKQFPIKFNFLEITENLYPDPYIAGALIINGRYDTPYINLPRDRDAADQLFAHKYNLNFADKLEDNTVFYKWDGDTSNTPITWKEFFPKYDFYVTSKKINFPLIPIDYTQSSIINRRKFIRGVFDVGYSKDIFQDTVGIANINEERLKEVQKILWSLGISSKISYDPDMKLSRGREFRLNVLSPFESYPGFFYDINTMFSLINKNDCIIYQSSFQFKIKSISKIRNGGCIIDKGFMSNLILEKPNALYITENFIPRVSL